MHQRVTSMCAQRIVEYLKEAGNTMEQIEEMLATTI